MAGDCITFSKVSYDLSGAAEACGLSVRELQRAIADGELIAHYRGVKPLIRAVELDDWIASLPTERGGRR